MVRMSIRMPLSELLRCTRSQWGAPHAAVQTRTRIGERRKSSLRTALTSTGAQTEIVSKRPWMMRLPTTMSTLPPFYGSTARGLRFSQVRVHSHRLELTAASMSGSEAPAATWLHRCAETDQTSVGYVSPKIERVDGIVRQRSFPVFAKNTI